MVARAARRTGGGGHLRGAGGRERRPARAGGDRPARHWQFPGADLRSQRRRRRLSRLRPRIVEGRLRGDRADEPAFRRAQEPHRAALPACRPESSGIELARMQRLLDEVLQEPRVDAERVGMWVFRWAGWRRCSGCRWSRESRRASVLVGSIIAATRWSFPTSATVASSKRKRSMRSSTAG